MSIDVSLNSISKKISILIVDNHISVRKAFTRVLNIEPDFEIIGEAQDGFEAIELAEKHLPDVILMDVNMPKLNGIDATRVISKKHPDIHIIGLSMFEEEKYSKCMRGAGAIDYISKCGPIGNLIAAIRACMSNVIE